jgi:hypothetical protein
MAKYEIYKITNTHPEGKNSMYIGQTRQGYLKRFAEHLKKDTPTKNCTKLGKAFKKYGREYFEIELICECKDQDELNNTEHYYIQSCDTIRNGYNVLDQGSFINTPEGIRQYIIWYDKTIRSQRFNNIKTLHIGVSIKHKKDKEGIRLDIQCADNKLRTIEYCNTQLTMYDCLKSSYIFCRDILKNLNVKYSKQIREMDEFKKISDDLNIDPLYIIKKEWKNIKNKGIKRINIGLCDSNKYKYGRLHIEYINSKVEIHQIFHPNHFELSMKDTLNLADYLVDGDEKRLYYMRDILDKKQSPKIDIDGIFVNLELINDYDGVCINKNGANKYQISIRKKLKNIKKFTINASYGECPYSAIYTFVSKYFVLHPEIIISISPQLLNEINDNAHKYYDYIMKHTCKIQTPKNDINNMIDRFKEKLHKIPLDTKQVFIRRNGCKNGFAIFINDCRTLYTNFSDKYERVNVNNILIETVFPYFIKSKIKINSSMLDGDALKLLETP